MNLDTVRVVDKYFPYELSNIILKFTEPLKPLFLQISRHENNEIFIFKYYNKTDSDTKDFEVSFLLT